MIIIFLDTVVIAPHDRTVAPRRGKRLSRSFLDSSLLVEKKPTRSSFSSQKIPRLDYQLSTKTFGLPDSPVLG